MGYSQVVRQRTLTPSFRWFESTYPNQFYAVLAQLAEHFLGKEEVDGSSPLNSSSINHIATSFARNCKRRYFYLKLRLRHLLRQMYQKTNFIFSTPPAVGVGNSQTPLQWTEITSLDFFKGVAFHDPQYNRPNFGRRFF